MPSNRIYKFSDINEAQAFLNGGLIGKDISKGGVAGLVGKTLTFTSPAFAVTFTAAAGPPTDRDPYTLLLKDIKAQVEAANADILVQSIAGKIVFIEKTPTNGVALSGSDEPAKSLLGFDQNSASVGKFYKPPDVSGDPNYTWAYSVNESTHVIYTWE
jgi:hypothetical protein